MPPPVPDRRSGRRAWRRLGIVLVAAAVAATSCGSSSSSDEELPRAAQDLRVAIGRDPFGGGGQGGGQGGQGQNNQPGQPQAGQQNQAGQNAQGGQQNQQAGQGQGGQGQGQFGGGGGGGGNNQNNGGQLGPRSARINLGIFETLTRLTPGFGVAPGLATRWEAPSPIRWRFTLRPGVTFHNGEPLDAEAVVAVLHAAARRQDPIRGLEENSARADGDRVVEINLTTANLRLPEQLAAPSMGIWAPGTTGGRGDEPATTPTGTGPFKFGAYTPGVSVKVVGNDTYWGGTPRLRSITFRFSDPDDIPALLANGEVDAAVPPTTGAETVDVDKPPPSVKVVVSGASRSQYVLMNAAGVDEWAVLNDPEVRRAVALALDREAFTKAVGPSQAKPNRTLVPPSLLGSAENAVASPGRDLAAAAAALDKTGWIPAEDGVRAKGGQRLVLRLLVTGADEQDAAITSVTGALGEVGIAVELQQSTGAVPLQLVNQGRFHLYMESRLQDDANPCAICRLFSTRPGGVLSVSSAVGGGPKADDLFDQAFTVPQAADAGKYAADLLHVVTAERFVAVPLSLTGTVWMVAPYVRGFAAAPVPGAQSWQGTWLAA